MAWGAHTADRGRAADRPTPGRRGGPDGRDRSGRADIATDGTATDDATTGADDGAFWMGARVQEYQRRTPPYPKLPPRAGVVAFFPTPHTCRYMPSCGAADLQLCDFAALPRS
jgi:hypothetical protein